MSKRNPPDPDGLKMQVRPLRRFITANTKEQFEKHKALGAYLYDPPPLSSWTTHDGLVRFSRPNRGKKRGWEVGERGWCVAPMMSGMIWDYDRKEELSGFYLPGSEMVAGRLFADYGLSSAIRFPTLRSAAEAVEYAIDIGLEDAYRELLRLAKAGLPLEERTFEMMRKHV